MLFQIHRANPESFVFEPLHEVPADKSSGSAHQNSLHTLPLSIQSRIFTDLHGFKICDNPCKSAVNFCSHSGAWMPHIQPDNHGE